MMYIVNSLLDDDLYKIGMMRALYSRVADEIFHWDFKCRTPGIKFTQKMVNQLYDEIDHLCTLRFTEKEIENIASIRYHHEAIGFHELLRMFQLNRNYIHIEWDPRWDIPIIWAEGPSWAVELFEIHVLQIFEGIWFQDKINWDILDKNLDDKIKYWSDSPFYLSEFGTRRRASYNVQDTVIRALKDNGPKGYLLGTSNMHFAFKNNLVPNGTFAHSWVSSFQGLSRATLANSQKVAWQTWCDVYRGDVGTCLTDTLGWNKFAKDFDRYFGNLFTGVRHDSGDPIEWGEKMIALYKSLDIDPKSKTLLFSDSLNFEKARRINNAFSNQVGRIIFGIGTYLSNDCGVEPLNVVFKLQAVNGKAVAKISDAEGKTMCQDSKYLEYLKWAIK